MEKIGKPFAIFFIICSFCLAPAGSLFGQTDITVEATVSETTVYTGERISLSIKLSGDFNNVSRPQLPDFPGFRLLSNNPSTSRSYSFVNGRSSTSYSYTYYLVARDKGSYRIPAVSINIDNREYTTKPIDVSIIDRNEAADSNTDTSAPEIFLRMEVSDRNPVPSQQLIADIVLFFKDGLEVNSYQPVPGWKAEGFWKEELENTSRPRAESTIIDGIRYRRARLLQFALFPTKNGKLTISPYQIVVSVRAADSRDDPFSSFFGGFGSNRRQVELKTKPVELTVRELPELTGATYIGAVGSFEISRDLDSRQAVVGESIEITTRFDGAGNIPLITKPEYHMPDGLEIYEPQESSAVNRKNQRISGTKTFTDVVIARAPGTFTVPAKTIAYYNPSRQAYVRKTLPALSFTVERNPEAVTSTEQSASFNIKPVTGLASWQSSASAPPLTRWWFWTGLLVPLTVLGLAYWGKTYFDRMHNDLAFARSQKAAQKAEARLQEAIEISGEGRVREAYSLLQKALTGFISDRLNLPQAGLANEQYIEALSRKGVDENLVKNIRMLLDRCSSISYAPDTTHNYLKSHVGLAQSILEKLKKEL